MTSVAVESTILVQDVDEWQIVFLAQVEIIVIMSRCQLDCASTELSLDIFIGDDPQLPIRYDRVLRSLADKVLVSIVLRVQCQYRPAWSPVLLLQLLLSDQSLGLGI